MENLVPVLAEHPFFQGFDPKYLELLQDCASLATFKANQLICSEGQPAQAFILLRSGRVAVEIHRPRRGTMIVQTLGEGDLLGWSWFGEPKVWTFDARALELTRALVLDATCVLQVCETHPDFEVQFLRRFSKVLAGKIKTLKLQLVDFYGD